MQGNFHQYIPVEIEALYPCHHVVITGATVVKVAPEGIFPVTHQYLAVDEGGVGTDAAIWPPQTIRLRGIKVTDKPSNVASTGTDEVYETSKTVDW